MEGKHSGAHGICILRRFGHCYIFSSLAVSFLRRFELRCWTPLSACLFIHHCDIPLVVVTLSPLQAPLTRKYIIQVPVQVQVPAVLGLLPSFLRILHCPKRLLVLHYSAIRLCKSRACRPLFRTRSVQLASDAKLAHVVG